MTPALDTLDVGARSDALPDGAGGEGVFAPARFPPYAPRTFAGLPIATIVLGALVLVMALWAAWATRELVALRSHRIVSVSLGTMVRDFVAAEARAKSNPDEAAYRTRVYLDTTQATIRQMASHGTTILVSEAVMGNSVPDVTPTLKAAIDAKLGAAHAH